MSTHLTQTTYGHLRLDLDKPSHEYTFDLNHIGMPSTQPTHALHHIHTHMQTQTHTHTNSHAYTYTYKLTYAQPPPYISTSLNLNIHTHGLTITHIYAQIQEHSVPNIFLSFHNIQSIVRVSENPNPNPG